MNVPQLHARAIAGFGQVVKGISDDQWSAPTPCTEWDVRALLAHIVDEELWTPPLMEGRTIEEIGDPVGGDPLGDDPKAAFDRSARGATEAVTPEAMDRTVHLSFGDFPGSEYAMQLFTDHLIHTWDLARAVGGNETLDPELVAACAGWFEEREEMYRGAGVIADRTPGADGGDPQTSLLARFGREP